MSCGRGAGWRLLGDHRALCSPSTTSKFRDCGCAVSPSPALLRGGLRARAGVEPGQLPDDLLRPSPCRPTPTHAGSARPDRHFQRGAPLLPGAHGSDDHWLRTMSSVTARASARRPTSTPDNDVAGIRRRGDPRLAPDGLGDLRTRSSNRRSWRRPIGIVSLPPKLLLPSWRSWFLNSVSFFECTELRAILRFVDSVSARKGRVRPPCSGERDVCR